MICRSVLPPGNRDHRRAERLGPVMRPQPAREQPVPIRVLHDVPAVHAARRQTPHDHLRPTSKSSCVYATTMGLPVVPLDACNRTISRIGLANSAEGIRVAQVRLDRERQLGHVLRARACRRGLTSAPPSACGNSSTRSYARCHDRPQPRELHVLQLRQRQKIRACSPDVRGGRSRFFFTCSGLSVLATYLPGASGPANACWLLLEKIRRERLPQRLHPHPFGQGQMPLKAPSNATFTALLVRQRLRLDGIRAQSTRRPGRNVCRLARPGRLQHQQKIRFAPRHHRAEHLRPRTARRCSPIPPRWLIPLISLFFTSSRRATPPRPGCRKP